jgi:hypothetical protein
MLMATTVSAHSTIPSLARTKKTSLRLGRKTYTLRRGESWKNWDRGLRRRDIVILIWLKMLSKLDWTLRVFDNGEMYDERCVGGDGVYIGMIECTG